MCNSNILMSPFQHFLSSDFSEKRKCFQVKFDQFWKLFFGRTNKWCKYFIETFFSRNTCPNQDQGSLWYFCLLIHTKKTFTLKSSNFSLQRIKFGYWHKVPKLAISWLNRCQRNIKLNKILQKIKDIQKNSNPLLDLFPTFLQSWLLHQESVHHQNHMIHQAYF